MGCFCPTGFIGKFCDIPSSTNIVGKRQLSYYESCFLNPCRNSAICVSDDESNFVGCFCLTGYTGKYCEIAPGCKPNPCLNGGVCTPSGCICGSGYSGKACEFFDTETLCDNIQCKNGGRCSIIENDIAECRCLGSYHGYYCELSNGSI